MTLLFKTFGFLLHVATILVGVLAGRAVGARLLHIPVSLVFADAHDSYMAVVPSRRALWHACGPLGAYVACGTLMFFALLGYGGEEPTMLVNPYEGSPAEVAGVLEGDRIISVDGTQVHTWDDVVATLKSARDHDLEPRLVLERNGQEVTVTVVRVRGRIGLRSIMRPVPLTTKLALERASVAPWTIFVDTVKEVARGLFASERVPWNEKWDPPEKWMVGFWPVVAFVATNASQTWPSSFLLVAALAPLAARRLAPDSLTLAGRDRRLFACLTDVVFTVVAGAVLAAIVALAGHEGVAQRWYSVGFGLALCLQWWLIATTGQSIGKRALGIRIVRHDGSNVGFVRGVLLRSWLVGISWVLPHAGVPIFLGDSLCIFGNRRDRCVHDYIAGTLVVMVRSVPKMAGMCDPAEAK